MEPVAKAERYVVRVMEVVDEGDGHDHAEGEEGEDEEEEEGGKRREGEGGRGGGRVHEEVNVDGIRNACRIRACRQVRKSHRNWGSALCNVGGKRSDA